MPDLKIKYDQRASDFDKIAKQLEAKYNKFAIVRLLVFILGITITIYLMTVNVLVGILALVGFLLAFARFVKWHLNIQATKNHNVHLHTINVHEGLAVEHEFQQFENGEEFSDHSHPYATDLDIFGSHSFFQYCNRTSTVLGKQQLASYFKNLVPKAEILERQAAITELRDLLDWRQNFQAYGKGSEDNLVHLEALKKWLTLEPFVKDKMFFTIAFILAPIIFGTGIYLWADGIIPWQALLLFVLPAGLTIKRTMERVSKVHHYTSHAGDILAYYSNIIEHIEKEKFTSHKLQQLQSSFLQGDFMASKSIRRLAYIISQLNVRYNAFAIFLNIIFLWDLHWVKKLEQWQEKHQSYLNEWLDQLAEFEALLSLATVYYNNSEWQFPTIQSGDHYEGIELGHPLINRKERISNDLNLPTKAHIKLITGSNMAGKSTFLRTVGLNIVMAMSGMPVCARSLKLPILQVYTTMRTQDALHESTSSFYAELKRLKQIIEAVDNGENIFFLMDEILKGTNSNDRHTGSKALIKQLIECQGSGLIATHDLELGALESSYGGAIENLCMEVQVNGDELVFDYKIKKGVSQSFNATQLMRRMGIKI